MHHHSLPVTALAIVLLAACGDNHIDVGAVDAATLSPSGSGGSGGPAVSGTGGAAPTTTTNSTGGAFGDDGGIIIADWFDAFGSAPAGCDPLALRPEPITLGTVLGVGKAADGTLYVADQVDTSTQRVFVSNASGILVRQHGGGSGSISDGVSMEYLFNAGDPASPFVLEIYVSTSGAVRMGVVQGSLKDSKTFVIGQQGEELTVLDAATVAAMPLQNFPGNITVEYSATLPDGQILLVTRPTDDWTYADFRLFLGPSTGIVERAVSDVSRALDGGSTIIGFDWDGAQASASFRVVVVDASFAPGPASITVGSTTTPLTRQSAMLPGTYLCL